MEKWRIKNYKNGAYSVITEGGIFRVVISEDLFTPHSCTCNDYKETGSECAHIASVMEHIEKGEVEEEELIFLDVETQFGADEVGGWGNIDKMKVAVVVIYSTKDEKYESYLEKDIPALVTKLKRADLIVGFNIERFDYTVIQPYTDVDLSSLPTLDMLNYIYKKLGYRVSLNALAKETLNAGKSGDGLQSLQWFRNGEIDKVIKYCIQDVKITKDLYFYGKHEGEVKFYDRRRSKVASVKVRW